MKNPSALKTSTRLGFTIIETMLALAIVVTSVLTVVALLPSGLEDLRLSSMKQAEARIIQTFVADYEMKSWGKAGANMTLPDSTLYFDIRGTLLPKAGGMDHAITAKATMQTTMPTLAGDQSPSKHLRKLEIRITNFVNNANGLLDPKLYDVRTAWVANFDETKM